MDIYSKGGKVLRLHPTDNVGSVIADSGILAGESASIECDETTKILHATQNIPCGHKIALADIDCGKAIIKYGFPIGLASKDIRIGNHVHTHNVEILPAAYSYPIAHLGNQVDRSLHRNLPEVFNGYRRTNGSVGTRNYILVVASVNCSATVVKKICRSFELREDFLKSKEIHGVIPVVHTLGCTQVPGGDSHKILNETIAGWLLNPNAVAGLIVGLGCEGTTPETIMKACNRRSNAAKKKIETFDIQSVGGTEKAIELGIKKIEEIVGCFEPFRREPCSVRHLSVALNCGGSDGYSGITANPALGFMSDLLVERGGSVVLGEIPECHGAENLLLSRCSSVQNENKLREIFHWWQEYVKIRGISLNANLAEGNKTGGLTTIVEKSLGAVAKAGSAPVKSVLTYSEFLTENGLAIMNTPGYDPASVTGLVASGCNIVAFTTGRGSVYGCSLVPTVKISTNKKVFEKMAGDMDFDATDVLCNGVISTGVDLYLKIIQVANGTPTKSESLMVGSEEFVPWSLGEML